MSEHMGALKEALTVGHRFSRQHAFSPEQVIAFALAAGDENPIHHDVEFASGTRFGGLIVSGTHTTALMMGLTASYFAQRGTVLGLHFSVDLLLPVWADETVTLEWAVESALCRPKGGHVLELGGAVRDCEGQVRVRARGRVLVGASLQKQAAAST
jgi:3-hydroxybutyryl-CoA dehydratase